MEYERDYSPPPDDILEEHIDAAGDSNHSTSTGIENDDTFQVLIKIVAKSLLLYYFI